LKHKVKLMGIKFCPKCEKVLVKRKDGDKIVYGCNICGYISDETFEAPKPKKISKGKLEKKKADNMLLIVDDKAKAKTIGETNLTCYRCGSHKIENFQLQMRRADEPATTFCRCANCGNRWRMS
jgi:transcription factor S